MKNWLEIAKQENEKFNESEFGKLSDGKIRQIAGGLSNKGIKHSDETKKIWSEKKKGHKRNEESVQKSIEGSKETKFLQLLETYPKKMIVDAIKKHGNHQNNICNELKCGIITLRKLCNHYKIEIPKKSNIERTEFAKNNQSESVLVWKVSADNKTKIGNPKEYYSVSECARQLQLHRGNLISNMAKGRAYNGYFFEKKNKA